MFGVKTAAALAVLGFFALSCVFAAEAPPAAAPPAVPETATSPSVEAQQTAIPITLDELKTLLDRKETPRVAVTNRYSTVIGKAVRIGDGQLFVDVTDERVAAAGVLGSPLSLIKSIKVLVPMSDSERVATQKASAEYLASIVRAQAADGAEPTAAETLGLPEEKAAGIVESTINAGGEKGPEMGMLEKYPPSDGWGPEKIFEITRKRIVLGLNPFGKDRSFLSDYDAWRAAYNAKRDEQLQMKAAYQSEDKPLPGDFEVLPELKPIPSLEGVTWQEEAPTPEAGQAQQ